MKKAKVAHQGEDRETPTFAEFTRKSPRNQTSKEQKISTIQTRTKSSPQKRVLAVFQSGSSSGKKSASGERKLSALALLKKRAPKADDGSARVATFPPEEDPIEEAIPQNQPIVNQGYMRAGVPPTTVAEAQELGEQARLRDDAMWALEGLATGTGLAKQESLATVIELYASRRNRAALHGTSLGNDLIKGVGKMVVGDDAVLALGAATMLLLSTQPGTDPMVFAKRDMAEVAVAAVQCPSSLPRVATVSHPVSRILRVLHDSPAARVLPRETSSSPAAVTLVALSTALDPHSCPAEVDHIKENLRCGGVLQAVAQLAADQTRALTDPSPTMETVQSLWKLERALVVLEHSCFACMENEGHLVETEVTQGCPPVVVKMGLMQWLVQQLQALNRQAIIAGLKKDCLRALLAVLMNMTHNNSSGREKLVSISGLETVSRVLSKVCMGGPHFKGAVRSNDDLKAWVDELNGCIGLLINLAEGSRVNCARMRTLELSRPSSEEMEEKEGDGAGLVVLLSRLVSAVMFIDVGQGSLAGEVTLDALQSGEGEAAASIVEVYASILLGFLIEGDKESQGKAATLLPGGSILPVVAAVQKCLNFYVTAGALTQRTEASLRALLASLEADSQHLP